MLFCESTKPFLLARHCGLGTEASLAGMAVRKYLLLASQAVDLPFEAVAALEVALSFAQHVTFILPAGLGVQDLGYVNRKALGAYRPPRASENGADRVDARSQGRRGRTAT